MRFDKNSARWHAIVNTDKASPNDLVGRRSIAQNRSMKKVIQIFLGAVMAAAGASGVQAAETCSVSSVGNVFFNLVNGPPNMLDIGLSGSVPDGTVIWSSPITVSGSVSLSGPAGCTPGPVTVQYNAAGVMGPFNTSKIVNALGYRIRWAGGPLELPSGHLPLTTAQPLTLTPKNSFDWSQGTLTYEVVKVNDDFAAVGGVTYLPKSVAVLTMNGPSGQKTLGAVGLAYNGNSTNAIRFAFRFRPSCSVSSPSIQVPLGTVPLKRFTGVGSTSQQSRVFNIQLSCSGSSQGEPTKIHMTLTDHTNPSNRSDALSLTTNSTAQGVGIQVLNDTGVIKYGPDSSAVGNPNQWSAGSLQITDASTVNIPLTARYVQTAPTVTPGSANGLVTFTMSYQ